MGHRLSNAIRGFLTRTQTTEPTDLISFYLDCETSRVLLTDGPSSGEARVFSGHRPPPMVVVPTEDPVRRAVYEPVLDPMGFCSRADDGAYRFRCTAA